LVGTIKGWINEVEKHHDDFIWKLIYEEAPDNVREFGVQTLSTNIKKKSEGIYKIVNKLKNKRKSLSSKTEELKLWSDRVLTRLEFEVKNLLIFLFYFFFIYLKLILKFIFIDHRRKYFIFFKR